MKTIFSRLIVIVIIAGFALGLIVFLALRFISSEISSESAPSSSFSRLLSVFSSKEEESLPVRPEYSIRIPEGRTIRDISQYLEGEGRFQSEEILEVAGFPQVDYRQEKDLPLPYDFSSEYSFLKDKPEYYGLEGYLFPDTYRLYASSTATDVLRRLLDNFDRKLTPELRAAIISQKRNIHEVVTLASIIEKEAPINYAVGDNQDARIIAGIFLNRLEIGQALQADATLSYIFSDNKPAHSGAELEVDSPYNTYKYRGLPPGPICNPGILAIEAAIYPLTTDYYYFLTTEDGRVVYARTYEEHLRNKNRYLR